MEKEEFVKAHTVPLDGLDERDILDIWSSLWKTAVFTGSQRWNVHESSDKPDIDMVVTLAEAEAIIGTRTEGLGIKWKDFLTDYDTTNSIDKTEVCYLQLGPRFVNVIVCTSEAGKDVWRRATEIMSEIALIQLGCELISDKARRVQIFQELRKQFASMKKGK